MPIYVGDSSFEEVQDNGRYVTEFSSGVVRPLRPVSRGGKSNADAVPGTTFETNIIRNFNSPLGSAPMATNGRFTAPLDGAYMINFWIMFENVAQNNRRYRVRKNDSGGVGNQVYVYGSNFANVHVAMPTSYVFDMNEGDYLSVYVDNITIYGRSSGLYTSFDIIYLG